MDLTTFTTVIILISVGYFIFSRITISGLKDKIQNEKAYGKNYENKYNDLLKNLSDYKNELKDIVEKKMAELKLLEDEYKHEIMSNNLSRLELEEYYFYIKKHYPNVIDQFEIYTEAYDSSPLEKNGWLTKEEYNVLSEVEKNNLAFERYKKNKKNKWQIGRDFEMYCGYKWEEEGFEVEYHGIANGKQDLGRDLLAYRGDEVFIIQCKYWSTKKTIHENHLCQLYGTTIMYEIEHPEKKVYPVFICHNSLSDTARKFANKLNIILYENIELGEYPAIKLNPKTNIFFLPFDLNYDELKDYELVFTIEEAINKGYRRRFKWSHLNN